MQMGWVSIDRFGANKLGCVVSENKQIITISQLKEENREVCINSLTLLGAETADQSCGLHVC